MKKKKRGTITHAKLKKEILRIYSLKQVCNILNGYINGDVTILCKPSYKYIRYEGLKKKETQAVEPLCPTDDDIIASIGYFGHRILLKFSKFQIPHPDRMAVGAACLKIAERLEGEGKLPECSMERIIAGQYAFQCRTYRTKSLGDIRIPELPGEKVGGEGEAGGAQYDIEAYRQLVSKKTATAVIKQHA